MNKDKIEENDLPSWIKASKQTSSAINDGNYYSSLIEFEKRFLISAMQRYFGKINLTAQSIGISKVTLISKLKKYDIDRRDYKQTFEDIDKAYGF